MKKLIVFTLVIFVFFALSSCDGNGESGTSSPSESSSYEISENQSKSESTVTSDETDTESASEGSSSDTTSDTTSGTGNVVDIRVEFCDINGDNSWQVLHRSVAEILIDYIDNGNWIDGKDKNHNAGYIINYNGNSYHYWAPAGMLIDEKNGLCLYLPSGGTHHHVINGALGYNGPVDVGGESRAMVLIKGNSPSATHIPGVYIPLTEEEEDRLYNAIINGYWADETCDCYGEFLFEVIMPDGGIAKMRYTYVGGEINDETNKRHKTLDEETRKWLDGILRQYIVFEEENPSQETTVSLTVSPSYDNDISIPLTKNEEKIIIGHILSVENWINDNCECIYDCVFRLHKDGKDIKIGYSLTCGTLNVFETPRSCQLSESAKEEIGAILTPRILPFTDC